MNWELYLNGLPGLRRPGVGFVADVDYRINNSLTKVFVDCLADHQIDSYISHFGHIWFPGRDTNGGTQYYSFGIRGELTGEVDGSIIRESANLILSDDTISKLVIAGRDLARAHPALDGSLDRCITSLQRASYKH